MDRIDWTHLVADATAEAPTPTTPASETPMPVPPLPDPAADAAGAALHPQCRLVLTELLDGQHVPGSNLCVVIGIIRRDARPRDRRARRLTSAATDAWQERCELEINDVLASDGDASVTAFRLPLQISPALLERGLFTDGQTVALGGPLQYEQHYDARFANADQPLDPGRPDWTLRLQTAMAQAVDPSTPHGSHVQLVGAVDGPPRVRRQVDGPRAEEGFATVRLRVRRVLKSGFAGSKAQFVESTLLPLDVPLSGLLPDAGALLRPGNQVLIHGRLVLYRFRRPTSRPDVQAAAAHLAADIRTRQGGSSAADQVAATIRRAQQRLLTVVKPTIQVGYVELRHGTALDADGIAQLLAERRRERAARSTAAPLPSPDPAEADAALDAATLAALEPTDTSANPAPVAPVRPRTRRRELSPPTDGDVAQPADGEASSQERTDVANLPAFEEQGPDGPDA